MQRDITDVLRIGWNITINLTMVYYAVKSCLELFFGLCSGWDGID
jgi:hypothetical protein